MEKMPKELERIIHAKIERELRKNDTSAGQLTDAEKAAWLEVQELADASRQIREKLKTKQRLFWAILESRLEIYDKNLHLDEKTGEVFVSGKRTREEVETAVREALKGTPLEGAAENFSFDVFGDDEEARE